MSKFRDKMKQQKEDLAKRHERTAGAKNQGRWGTIFIKEQIPEGIGMWVPDVGEHSIDAIPFFSGPDHPEGENKLFWYIFLQDHTRIGPLDDAFVCPAFTFRKPCPVEEYLARNRLPKEEWSIIKAKDRDILFVWVHDNVEEENKGIQIWYCPDFFFGSKIDKISKRPKGGGIIPFWDVDEGKTICFSIEKKGKDNIEYVGHRFIDREQPIPDNIIEQIFPLDRAIKWNPSYEEIDKALKGQVKKTSQTPTEESTLEEQKKPDIEYGPDTTGTGTFCSSCGKPQFETPSGVTCENGHGGSDAKEPVKEKKASEPKKEEKKTEPKKESQSSDGTKCNKGFTLGVEIDKHPECRGCEQWDDCFDVMQLLQEGSKPAKEESKAGGRLLRR